MLQLFKNTQKRQRYQKFLEVQYFSKKKYLISSCQHCHVVSLFYYFMVCSKRV